MSLDGPGFPPEVLLNMFKHRVKGEDSSGQGLGLAFINAVARALGGAADASNRPGGGARIIVTLPLSSSAHAESAGAMIGDRPEVELVPV
jgi:signal transduction histidine kinase